ncbi:hypothetical protein NLI96_g11433 [Meripilus lineatus]|uniref:ABC transporter domain-containing protein n=1 Tax=Meripilus lineatus TaxID=2056292 RepID=A0AAD5URS5_9APHY|nr:hypothetical protein NLI96_g11433 [Physisporinus lineatus]
MARALLRRSSIIVLDEATSSIDFNTDKKIQATIREEFGDSLLLTVIDYDRLIILDKGELVEFDTPWNLIHKEGGIFRNMCLKSGSYSELEGAARLKAESVQEHSTRGEEDVKQGQAGEIPVAVVSPVEEDEHVAEDLAVAVADDIHVDGLEGEEGAEDGGGEGGETSGVSDEGDRAVETRKQADPIPDAVAPEVEDATAAESGDVAVAAADAGGE